MEVQSYPFEAFVLTPSFNIKRVTIVSQCRFGNWRLSEGGKFYSLNDLFATRDDAIDAGYRQLVAQKERLQKQLAGIERRTANLDKQRT